MFHPKMFACSTSTACLVVMGFTKGVLHPNMAFFYGYFWVSLSTFLLTLLGFLNRLFIRYNCMSEPKAENKVSCANCFEVKDANFYTSPTQIDQLDDKACEEGEADSEINRYQYMEVTDNVVSQQVPETPGLFFKFEFQTGVIEDTETAVAIPKRYDFVSGKSFSQFLEEAEASNHVVKELNIEEGSKGQLGDEAITDSGFLADWSFVQDDDNKAEVVHLIIKDEWLKVDAISLREPPNSDQGQTVEFNANKLAKEVSAKSNSLGANEFIGLDSEPASRIADLKSPVTTALVGSSGDWGSCEKDSETAVTSDAFAEDGEENTGMSDLDLEETNSDYLKEGYEPDDFDVEDNDIFKELRELEATQIQYSNAIRESSHSSVQEGFDAHKGKRPADDLGSSQKPNLENQLVSWDSEDSNPLETLWEHQDLIEQLKMELKKVRATGLPTILEESECPKLMENLKPWKIDEKIQHNGRTNELPKFYKSYRERMRKFDILNYQKMYALGYLQSKDLLQSLSRDHSASAFTSLVTHSFRLWRPKKSSEADDPMKKFIKEIYGDLETVYVGQLCLSWEFLHWQYVKALELWENDPYLSQRYNEVAGEFQQFQVLLQRFMENEPFQGPRVENYTKNRCQTRNLLQVPIIKEVNVTHRKPRRKARDSDAVTSEMLVEILEESIRTIWQFIRADKDAHNMNLKYPHQNQDLQNPADAELLKEIRLDLQKKEKKLKEQLKSGHCILKKLQKHKDDETNQFLYFFSQVDMKLARRVLNMSRLTTEQLSWCRSKLNSIHFVNRRIHVEPSFLLFPYS